MKTKIILNGAMMMCLVFISAPAFADNDEYVINETYENSCNSGVLGVFSGTVSAIANFETCPSGEYADNNSCVSCPTGFETTDSGAGVADECYTSCVASDVAHAATVTGRNYYGNGTDTCSATSCVSGYHVQAEIIPNSTVQTAIGSVAGTANAYINNSGSATGSTSTYGISDNNSFAVDYGSRGVLIGHARCSKTPGYKNPSNPNSAYYDNPTSFNTLADETDESNGGQYCYCSVDGYTPNGGTLQNVASAWVYYSNQISSSGCASNCANNCVYGLKDTGSTLVYRSALLGSVGTYGPSTCAANTINVNWQNAEGGTHASNTCVYDGTLTTPTTAPTKYGHVFTGWTFQTNNQ